MVCNDKIGDTFTLTGPNRKVEVVIMEIDSDGCCIKAKAKNPDPSLGKLGFFLEGNDWVVFDFVIVTNN